MLLENQAALAKRERKIPTELSFNEEVVETENGSVTFFDPAPLWEKVTGEDKAAAALGFHEAVIRIVERMSEKQVWKQLFSREDVLQTVFFWRAAWKL